MRHLLLASLATIVLAACASTDGDTTSSAEAFAAELASDPRVGEQVDRICFSGSIDSFAETTDRSVVVSVSPTRDFLITTRGRCFDLDFAQAISFEEFGACLTRGDRLYPFDSVFGRTHKGVAHPGCLIDRIYAWDRDAEQPDAQGESEGETDTPEETEG